jgi:protein-tyrosine phosphatase
MAAVMAVRALADAGLGDQVTVSSVGTGGWHVGSGMDPRAAAELERHGHDHAHVAAQLSESDHSAGLLVALDRSHRAHLHHVGVDPDRVRLLRDFDPAADSPDVADPYYGDHHDFARTRLEISRALPGLVAQVRALLG